MPPGGHHRAQCLHQGLPPAPALQASTNSLTKHALSHRQAPPHGCRGEPRARAVCFLPNLPTPAGGSRAAPSSQQASRWRATPAASTRSCRTQHIARNTPKAPNSPPRHPAATPGGCCQPHAGSLTAASGGARCPERSHPPPPVLTEPSPGPTCVRPGRASGAAAAPCRRRCPVP